MAAVIDDPILNRPFVTPTRHFRFDDDSITDEIVERRRPSGYFVPIPRARKRGQQTIDEYTADRAMENDLVNQIRGRVSLWRDSGWPGVTPTTRWLLRYWSVAERDRRLFFCQLTEQVLGHGEATCCEGRPRCLGASRPTSSPLRWTPHCG